jgi:hypothetical protein
MESPLMEQNPIARLTTVDFFAAIPSGMYVFLVAHATYSATTTSLWQYLVEFAGVVQETPALAVLVLFGAFLFGSIIRSIPVDWADACTTLGRGKSFPYVQRLRHMRDRLIVERGVSNISEERLPDPAGVSRITFNYWKDFLCIEAPAAFSFYETFEARSRFFAGMFWAGVAGLGGAVIAKISSISSPSSQIAVLSLTLVAAFGLQLRRVRAQEASVLFTLIAVLRQKLAASESSTAPTAGNATAQNRE